MDSDKKILFKQQLLSIKTNLNIVNNELDNLKASIKMGIMINNEVIGNNNIQDIKNSIDLVISELNDIVIPIVENSIN